MADRVSDPSVRFSDHSHVSLQRTRRYHGGGTTAVFHEARSPPVSRNELHSLSFVIAPKWRQVASRLKPQAMDLRVVDDIASQCSHDLQGQAIRMLQMWSDKYGGSASVNVMCEVLVNADCRAEAEEVFGPNTVQQVYLHMSDTEIESSDRLLYELSEEIDGDWKELAIRLGMKFQHISVIEQEVQTPKDQACKMLQKFRSMKGSDFKIDIVHGELRQIRKKKQTAQLKDQIFPQNILDDTRFCGRNRELDDIARTFWGDQIHGEEEEIPKLCLQVVNGMGGIGKSSVAERYAFLWKETYRDGIFHFNTESVSSLHMSIRQNLRHLSNDSSKGGIFADNDVLLQHVCRKGRVLLLYDAAYDLHLLQRVLPRETARVHVLVTTRMSGDHPVLARADRVTHLGCLGPETSVKLLQAWRGCEGEELDTEEMMAARHVVSVAPVEGLPLAIVDLAKAMRTNVSYQKFAQLFNEQNRELQALSLNVEKLLHDFRISSLSEGLMHHCVSQPDDVSRLSNDDVDSIAGQQNEKRFLYMARYFLLNSNHVHLTWQLDIEIVKETDSNAMQLLLYASLMACRNIPERVLRPLVFSDGAYLQYQKSVTTLTSNSLVAVSANTEGDNFDLHPLVQSAAFERVLRQPGELSYRLTNLCHCLVRLLPHSDDDIRSCLEDEQFSFLIPHVYAVAEKAARIRDDKACATLVEVASRIALIFQHVREAAFLCHEMLKATDRSADIRQRWTVFYNMGRAFRLQVNPQAAQTHLLGALQLIEKSSQNEQAALTREYQLALGELAACYQDQQMFTEAEDRYLTLLSLLNERPELNKREIAVALNNLAENYFKSGRVQKAVEVFQQVLHRETASPSNDPLSLSKTLEALGMCFIEIGQHDDALPLLERCISIRRERLSNRHLDVAKALNNLGSYYSKREMFRDAVITMEECVEVARSFLTQDHPSFGMVLWNLGNAYEQGGEIVNATKLFVECLSVREKSLPATHSHIIAVLWALGRANFVQERHGECLRMNWRIHNILKETSPESDEMATVWYNIGLCYATLSNLDEAQKALEQSLKIRRDIFPAGHDIIDTTERRLHEVLQLKSGQRDGKISTKGRQSYHELQNVVKDSPSFDLPDDKRFKPEDLKYDDTEDDHIGRGGFADVYKALIRQEGQDVIVALKRPYNTGSRFTKEEMHKLRKEAAILLAIPPHVNIVKIIGVCDDSRDYGLLLEFIDGGDLHTLLCPTDDHDPYVNKWRNRLDMGRQIADGMKHLHSLHPPVIHRDLKPRNILVKKSSSVYVCKITDFGLSKIRATSSGTTRKSGEGSLHAIGTMAYIAPEHYSPEHLDLPLAMKSDVYSFGVILWQFQERKVPFESEMSRVIEANVKAGVPFNVARQPCPAGYGDVTKSCCSFHPKDRPAFAEIMSVLQKMYVNSNEPFSDPRLGDL